MMTMHKIISRNPEPLQFLFKVLLNDTYSALGLNTFMELFNSKLTKEDVVELRSANMVKVICASTYSTNMLDMTLVFFENTGYSGGEFSKTIRSIDIVVQQEVMLYLMIAKQDEIQIQKHLLESKDDGMKNYKKF